MKLVSACLAGVDCAWDGKSRLNPEIKDLLDKKLAISVCPEVLGGRGIPRTRTEIKGGNGEDVLDGRAKVFDENGKDVTGQFLKGARKVLELIKKHRIKEAILKSRSPSCGVGKIYDGSFKGTLVDGDGVTASLLKSRLNPEIKDLLDKKLAISACPEVLGGRGIPRRRTEIKGGKGEDVLDGRAKVFDEKGLDVTDEFLKGACKVLELVKKHRVKESLLKSKSPSCGVGKIYDGSFTGRLVDGDGVTASLLKRIGILCRSI